jgi:hypothetical protein
MMQKGVLQGIKGIHNNQTKIVETLVKMEKTPTMRTKIKEEKD